MGDVLNLIKEVGGNFMCDILEWKEAVEHCLFTDHLDEQIGRASCRERV